MQPRPPHLFVEPAVRQFDMVGTDDRSEQFPTAFAFQSADFRGLTRPRAQTFDDRMASDQGICVG